MQQKWSPLGIVVLLAVAGGVLSGGLESSTAEAAPKKAIVGREPWPGRRVVLVLPLKLGETWNSDQEAGRLLLGPAQDELHKALQATGKFSLVEAHRFNPILVRAVQDKLATQEHVDELVNNPGLESARQVLSGMTFTQQPLIADFRLDEVRMSGTAQQPEYQVQVSGRLYEVTNPAAIKAVSVTSNPVRRTKAASVLDTVVLAAADGFTQIVAQFIAPLPDIEFAPIQTEPAPAVTPSPALPTTPSTPGTSTGGAPGTAGGLAGSSSAGSPFPMPVVPQPAPGGATAVP